MMATNERDIIKEKLIKARQLKKKKSGKRELKNYKKLPFSPC